MSGATSALHINPTKILILSLLLMFFRVAPSKWKATHSHCTEGVQNSYITYFAFMGTTEVLTFIVCISVDSKPICRMCTIGCVQVIGVVYTNYKQAETQSSLSYYTFYKSQLICSNYTKKGRSLQRSLRDPIIRSLNNEESVMKIYGHIDINVLIKSYTVNVIVAWTPES